jgi:hypothetical protein
MQKCKFYIQTHGLAYMQILFDFITLVHLAAAVLGIVFAIFIFYFGFKTNPANQPLAIAQLSISLAVFVAYIYQRKNPFYRS